MIEDGNTYEGDLVVTVDDPHLDYVKVDGTLASLVGGKLTVKADGKSHRIEIADKTGNTAVYNVTVLCVDGTDDKPSGGWIMPVVIGSVAVLAAGGFAIYWFVIKKKKSE